MKSTPLVTDQFLHDGDLTLKLLRRQAWIARRHEAVRFVGSHEIERTVTLVIDNAILRGYQQESTVPVKNTIAIPLIVLSKQLLLGFEVMDASGLSIPTLTSDADSTYAAGAMIAQLIDDKVPRERLTTPILDLIYQSARQTPSEVDTDTLSSAHGGEVEAWSFPVDDDVVADDLRQWKMLVENHPDFVDLLSTFTQSFMPMVMVDIKSTEVTSIRFKYLEVRRIAEDPTLFTRVGASWVGSLEAPGVGSGSREYLAIAAPEGLQLAEANLVEIKGTFRLNQMNSAKSKHEYERRVTPERAVIYTSGLRNSDYLLLFTMRPKRSGFLRQAQFTCLSAVLLLVSGLLLQAIGHVLTNKESDTVSTVALLLVVPSLMLALLARESEHELVSDLLRTPRLFIASFAGLNVVCAGALAIKSPNFILVILWILGIAVGILVFLTLSLIARVSKVSEEAGIKTANLSDRQHITVLTNILEFTAPQDFDDIDPLDGS